MLHELMARPNWLLWKYKMLPGKDKPTKVPYNTTGYQADVTNPRDLSPYSIVINTFNNGGYDGIGYAIRPDDNLTCIDLDDSTGDIATIHYQQQIVEAFDSYSELSPSGRGLHLWVWGKVAANRVQKGVEIYTAGHYMTMTFKPYTNKAIAERQELLTDLWNQCKPKASSVIENIRESEQLHSDNEIYEMAAAGKNSELFVELWNGKYDRYIGNDGQPDHSRGDFALINILGFYSRNVEQIKRMFLQSGMGFRIASGAKKKSRNYIENMARRSFDLQVPEVNVDAVKALFDELPPMPPEEPIALPVQEKIVERYAALAEKSNPSKGWDLPPGLMGRIAKYFYDAAPHPFQEIALGGAMSLMAGVVGRAYNISGTGLNQYIVVLAGTGTGKEAAASGINKLMAKVCAPENVPAASDFLGPADISSGPALIKQLDATPCFVSVMSEIGLSLQKWCAKHANSADVSFRKALLEIYTRSGDNQSHRPTVYSDRAKNTMIIKSPCFSILGESVPEEFYKIVDENSVSGGFLPRFTIMEYTGPRVHYNEAHELVSPLDDTYAVNGRDLVKQVCDLAAQCLNLMRMGKVIKVQLEAEALAEIIAFRTHCTNQINRATLEVEKQLWTRAYLKTLKLAALVAVGGDNINFPLITLGMVEWSKRIEIENIDRLMVRFEEGTVGMEQSEVAQREKVVAIVTDYIYRPVDKTMLKYGVSEKMHTDLVVPMGYFQKRLLSSPIFKSDRVGATNALARALANLCSEGSLVEKRPGDMARDYQKTAKAYQISNPDRFKK